MTLHAVPKPSKRVGPLYCGPMSICAVTGLDPGEVMRTVQRVRGNYQPVTGITTHEICAVMAVLGHGTTVYSPLERHLTLGTIVREMRPFSQTCILEMRGHFTAVSYDEMVDTYTGGRPWPICMAPWLRCRLLSVIEHRPLSPRRQRTAPRPVDRPGAGGHTVAAARTPA